jgi:P pilus assembly chaperone PapD
VLLPVDESGFYFSINQGPSKQQNTSKKTVIGDNTGALGGRKITATGIHLKNAGPPVKFRRNQYNQLNVTTNPTAYNANIFSSAEQQQ